MDFIIADEAGLEIGYLMDLQIDIDIGSKNDYEIKIPINEWESAGYSKGYRFYLPDTEYGGIIQNISRPAGEKDIIVLSGDIWRGMLSKKIIVPPAGQAYHTVSGDANAIIQSLLGSQFGDIFVVSQEDSGIVIDNYSFDRYTDILSGLTKMLLASDARLDFRYVQGAPGTSGHVEVQAAPIVDYSNMADYSDDYDKIQFSAYEVGNGINHLICLGKGELEARTVAHLYVDNEGNNIDKPYYTGLDERTAVYDYGSAETPEELIKGGKKRLKELMSYNKFVMHVSDDLDIPAAIGDIVGGRERTSGILIRQQVRQEILRYDGRKLSIEYTVGDIEKNNGTNVGGGEADYTGDIEDLNQKTDVLDTAIKVIEVKKLDVEIADITYATITNLDAANAKIDNLEVNALTADKADLKYASIDSLDAAAGRIDNLESTMITTDYLGANYLTTDQLSAKYATIQVLNAARADITQLNANKADIDLANVNNAWIVNGIIKEGAIGEATIHDGAITNAKIADATIGAAKIESINADVISTGTLKTERLIITDAEGNESIVKAINIANGVPVAEVNGQKIQAASIDVVDLSAFQAKIAQFDMSLNAIYSGKSSVADPVGGIYLSTVGIGMGDGWLTGKNESPIQMYADGTIKLVGKNGSLYFNAVTGGLDINATSIELSSKSVATSDDVVELRDEITGITVGGRNLFLNTDVVADNNSYMTSAYKPAGEPLIAGLTYTATICVTPASGVTHLELYFSGGNSPVARFIVSGTGKQIISKSFEMKYAPGMTPEDIISHSYAYFYRFPNDGTVTANTTIHWIKIEAGNKATDWTPAPEDVQNQIDNTVSLLNDLVSDSKLTPNEKVIAKKEWLIIADEYPKYITQAAGYKVSTTAYTNAYNALNSYLNTTNSGIIFNMNTTTDINSTTFTNNFKTYYNCKVELTNAISTAKAKYEADNLTIGGRNILLKSNISATNKNYRITTYESSLPLKANTDYTIVVRAKLVEGRNLNFYVGQTRGAPIKLASDGTEKTYYKQFTNDATEIITPNTVYFYNNIPDTSTGGGVEATVYWACLYEGHVKPPMQWIAAPEDPKIDMDNLEIGGRNLIENSSFSKNLNGWSSSNFTNNDGLTTKDGYVCLHVSGELIKTKHISHDIFSKLDTNNLEQIYAVSADIKLENYTSGSTNPFVKMYFSGSYDNNGTSTWLGSTILSGPDSLSTFAESGWVRSSYTFKFSKKPTVMRIYVYARDFTGDLYVKNFKLEKGSKATDWTPAPEDMASFDEMQNAQKAADDAQKAADDAAKLAGSTENRVTISEAKIKVLNDVIKNIVTDANGSTLMTQTSTGWTFDISGIEKRISDAVGSLNNLSGTVNEAENAITNLDKIVDDVIKKTAYIIMTTDDSGAPCIELGKEGNPFKVRITNTAVDFMQGTFKIAYISNNSLYIEKAVVKNELQIGDGNGFVWKKRASGNLGLRWV